MIDNPEKLVVEKGLKAMVKEMVTEEILACVELYSLQLVQLSSYEKWKVNRMVECGLGKQRGCKSLDLYGGERVGVLRKGNSGRDELKKRKAESLSVSFPVLSQPDAYVAPTIPPVRGLFGLIKQCTFPFEKQLTASDLNDDLSRFSFSRHDAENFLLPLVKGMNLKLGVPTNVYDMDGNSYPMTFKTWCDKYYVLTSGWKEYCNSHDLRPLEDFVTVWMFQHGVTKKICFALSSRRCNVHHLIKKVRKS